VNWAMEISAFEYVLSLGVEFAVELDQICTAPFLLKCCFHETGLEYGIDVCISSNLKGQNRNLICAVFKMCVLLNKRSRCC
jgi:hypothetical protein